MEFFGTLLQFSSKNICATCSVHALQIFPRTLRIELEKFHATRALLLLQYIFCITLFFLPTYSHAAVVFNEIAWMGNEASANDEWIELYNDGTEAVSVDGWIVSDGMNLEIVLTGSVAPGQYAVLERTDDSSAPGVAFLIYAGALTNVGATLSLYRADTSLEDRVAGGENWENIGGDNLTKETAQYTPSGWVTAKGTPGSSNAQYIAEVEGEPEDEISDEAGTKEPVSKSVSSDSSSVISKLYRTPREVLTTIIAPSRIYVKQEVSFELESSGISDPILNSLTHEWNFGDFNTASGEEVSHRFDYPGEYVVTLHSHYKAYDAYARKTVTVLPVSFSLSTSAVGDIQVRNDARYEVDLSGYSIIADGTLVFPQGTIMLPNSTITIPRARLHKGIHMPVVLSDDIGTTVATLTPASVSLASATAVAPPTAPVLKAVAYTPEVKSVETENFTFVGKDSVEEVTVPVQTLPSQAPVAQSAAVIEAAETIPNSMMPYLALLAVIGLAITAVFAGRTRD